MVKALMIIYRTKVQRSEQLVFYELMSSKIENSMITTGSNNWYSCVTKGEIVGIVGFSSGEHNI